MLKIISNCEICAGKVGEAGQEEAIIKMQQSPAKAEGGQSYPEGENSFSGKIDEAAGESSEALKATNGKNFRVIISILEKFVIECMCLVRVFDRCGLADLRHIHIYNILLTRKISIYTYISDCIQQDRITLTIKTYLFLP